MENNLKVKVFISQPMRGKTDEEIMQERQDVIRCCKDLYGEDTVIIPNYFDDEPDTKAPGLYYLGRSISLLADADIAYFVRGWSDARGCCIERLCAEDYGIEIADDFRCTEKVGKLV